MKSLITLIVLWGFLCNHHAVSARMRQTETEEELQQALLSDYVSYEKPPSEGEPNSTVNVDFGADLVKIKNLNEADGTLTAAFHFHMIWKDPRLSWNALAFHGIEVLRIPPHLIWKPDLMDYKGIDDSEGSVSLYSQFSTIVLSDGRVLFELLVSTKSPCAIDTNSDLQVCKIKIGSWNYDQSRVDLKLDSPIVGLGPDMPNSKWTLEKADIERNVVHYACCKEPFIDATVTVYLRRKN